MSKYISEKVWRDALDEVLGWVLDADRRDAPAQEREKLKHRFERIYLAGHSDWQDRYDRT